MTPQEACVPLSKRKKNKVDKLIEEIKLAQKICTHDFRLVKRESVNGVDDWVENPPLIFTVRCLKCSKKKSLTSVNTCPYCLGKMNEGDLLLRRKFFGKENIYYYYKTRKYSCTNCGLVGAVLVSAVDELNL